jgi:hypothetical protein
MSAEIVIDTGSGHTLADQLFGGDAGQTQLAQSGNAVQ